MSPDPAAPMEADNQPGWALPLIEFLKDAAEAGEVVTVTSTVPTMTPAEAAYRLNISRSTISRRIKAGEIRTIKIGNRHRIPISEFERFHDEMMQSLIDMSADDIEADLVDG